MGISASLPFLQIPRFDGKMRNVSLAILSVSCCCRAARGRFADALGLCTWAISGKSLSWNKEGSGTETEDRQDFNLTSTWYSLLT